MASLAITEDTGSPDEVVWRKLLHPALTGKNLSLIQTKKVNPKRPPMDKIHCQGQ